MIKWLLSWRPNQEQVQSFVRWVLGIAGAWAVQKGWIDDSQSLMIVGIGAAFVPLVWSFIVKTQAAQIKKAANIEGVTVLVGNDAPTAAKDLAADPAYPSIKEMFHAASR